MTLYLDSTDANGPEVALLDNGVEVVKVRGVAGMRQSQQILPLVDQALQESGFELSDVADIRVNLGPGSFTGTRVGVALANALSLALGVPVNGEPVGSFVALIYDSAPKISVAKTK